LTSIEPSRFDDGRAMLLGGVRRQHSFGGMAQSVPAQWQAFQELGTLPGQQGSTVYGVICTASPQEQTLEYMCGAEVASLDALPPGMGRMRIPAQHYAVFEHRGHTSTLRQTWDAIWSDWVPRSGRTVANTPDFEVYDERFDPRTGSGLIEIWIPMERA
jgi:AraC family transcriptional regulator